MNKLPFILISLLLISPLISAWGPGSHIYISDDLFNMQNSPKVIQDCKNYKDSFLAGTLAPDITVIYYYSEGGKEYKLTHNWNTANEIFSRAVTQDEICFAYGFASHLIQDSIAHNQAVPSAIKKIFIPNWLLHPLLEQKYNAIIVDRYDYLKDKTTHSLDIMSTSKGEKYIEMIQKSMGENTNIDVKNEMAKLQIAVGGNSFYEENYRPRGETLIFRSYGIIDSLTRFIQPFLGSLNIGITEFYFEKAQQLTISSMNDWGSRYQISPHGFEALSEADQKADLFNWIYILLIFAPTGFFIVRDLIRRKGFRWRHLIWIPIAFIVILVIIYAII